MKRVTRYGIYYKHQSHAGMIHLMMSDGTHQHFPFHTEGEATLLLDILRNEKPVYFDPDSEMIATGFEPVGEEEKPKPKRRTTRKKKEE